jgi:hypothetical protein
LLGGVDLGGHAQILPKLGGRPTPREGAAVLDGSILRIAHAVAVLREDKGTEMVIDAAARLHDLGLSNLRSTSTVEKRTADSER